MKHGSGSLWVSARRASGEAWRTAASLGAEQESPGAQRESRGAEEDSPGA